MSETLTVEKYNEIVDQYGNMLYDIAKTYKFTGDDFESCKSMAIWKAWKGFDSKKSKFITFLYTCMRQECNHLVEKVHRRRKIVKLSYVPNIQFRSIKDYRPKPHPDLELLPLEVLTEKEQNIIQWIQEGYTYAQIGQKLGGSYSSEKSGRQSVMEMFRSACQKLYIASEYRKHRTKLVCGTRD